MTHHEEEKNYDFIYYIVAMVSGMFVGAIIDKGIIWILVGGIFGLLTAAWFVKKVAKSSHE